MEEEKEVQPAQNREINESNPNEGNSPSSDRLSTKIRSPKVMDNTATTVPYAFQRDRSCLTPEQAAAAEDSARLKGLPEGFKAEWHVGLKKIVWVSPDGKRKCTSIPQAIKWTQNHEKTLTDDEFKHALNEALLSTESATESMMTHAKSKGLSDKWKKKVFVSPNGQVKCPTLQRDLAASVKTGLITLDELQLEERPLDPVEARSLLAQTKARCLPDGWTVVYSNTMEQNIWISPDRKRKYLSIDEAIEFSRGKGLLLVNNKPPQNGQNQAPTRKATTGDAGGTTKNSLQKADKCPQNKQENPKDAGEAALMQAIEVLRKRALVPAYQSIQNKKGKLISNEGGKTSMGGSTKDYGIAGEATGNDVDMFSEESTKAPVRRRAMLHLPKETTVIMTEKDIECGRGRGFWQRPANRKLKTLIHAHLPQYEKAVTKKQKIEVINSIYDIVVSDGSRFVTPNGDRWSVLGKAAGREKTSRALFGFYKRWKGRKEHGNGNGNLKKPPSSEALPSNELATNRKAVEVNGTISSQIPSTLLSLAPTHEAPKQSGDTAPRIAAIQAAQAPKISANQVQWPVAPNQKATMNRTGMTRELLLKGHQGGGLTATHIAAIEDLNQEATRLFGNFAQIPGNQDLQVPTNFRGIQGGTNTIFAPTNLSPPSYLSALLRQQLPTPATDAAGTSESSNNQAAPAQALNPGIKKARTSSTLGISADQRAILRDSILAAGLETAMDTVWKSPSSV